MGNYRPVYIIISYTSKPSWSTYIQTLLAPSSKSNTEMKLRIGTARYTFHSRMFRKKTVSLGVPIFCFLFVHFAQNPGLFSIYNSSQKISWHIFLLELPYLFRSKVCFFSTSLPKKHGVITSFLRFSFFGRLLPPTNAFPRPRPSNAFPPHLPTAKAVSLHRKEVDHCSGQAFEVLSHQSCHLLQAGSASQPSQPIPIAYTPPCPFGGRGKRLFGDFFLEPARFTLDRKKYTRWFPVGCWLFVFFCQCLGYIQGLPFLLRLGRELEGNSEGRLFFFRLKKKTVVI